MWKYHILHIETKLEFQAEDKKENINLLTFLCDSCQDVNYQLLLAESVNHRTIQLLMGVRGLSLAICWDVIPSEAEYQDYLYVSAGGQQTGRLFYWDITMQSRPNAPPVQYTPSTTRKFKKHTQTIWSFSNQNRNSKTQLILLCVNGIDNNWIMYDFSTMIIKWPWQYRVFFLSVILHCIHV